MLLMDCQSVVMWHDRASCVPPTLAIAECWPGKQEPMHENSLAGRQKKRSLESVAMTLDSQEKSWLLGSKVEERFRHIGWKWVTGDQGKTDI